MLTQPVFPQEIFSLIFSIISHPLELKDNGVEVQSTICSLSKRTRAMVKRGFAFDLRSVEDLDSLWTTVDAFSRVFYDQPFTFGDTKIIQVFIPTTGNDIQKVKDLFTHLRGVKEVNFTFYRKTEWTSRFFSVIITWAPFLQALEIMRFKYKIFNFDLESKGVASGWLSPNGWTNCICHFPTIRVIVIDTPQLAFLAQEDEDGEYDITTEAEKQWISTWSSGLSQLQRIYLNHAYDDELGVTSWDFLGSRNVFSRMEDGTFRSFPWRPALQEFAFAPAIHKPPVHDGRHRRVKKEDLDFYDSEEGDDCRIAGEDKDQYVDMW
ncbi:hypothetical protein CPB83DRAFT_852699 [Crepidotus variabilis]|uniref:Uncharacterized protein n=1 Tax=Crepidotus variabilis TaxID=179855 RepID=A0A9P6JRD2_9AGAR|nr:hypothetical protein CPB83DRAFT_852699 [Crepidotus variabilis]